MEKKVENLRKAVSELQNSVYLLDERQSKRLSAMSQAFNELGLGLLKRMEQMERSLSAAARVRAESSTDKALAERDFVGVREAADILDVTQQTVRVYFSKGMLGGKRINGGKILIRRKDVYRMIGVDVTESPAVAKSFRKRQL